MTDKKITFTKPSPEAPGYMKRMKRAVYFGSILSSGKATPEIIDELVDFLVDYVVEPANREEAKEALWDISEQQFLSLIDVVKGGSGDLIPPTNAAP